LNEERARRIGLNESVFRRVNEQLEDLAERFPRRDGVLDLVCECGNASCTARLRIEPAEYEGIRSDSRHFAIVPGHEKEDVEEVVSSGDGYDVVRKKSGTPTEVAVETDPRGGS
jgi:hypothetical protein